VILVDGFQKTFRVGLKARPVHAARGVSFEVNAGEVFGFLGPNGAGKTTTIKALLGLIRKDRGRLEILGRPVEGGEWRGKVGYMPEHPTFYDFLTAKEMTSWFGRLNGLNRTDAERRAERTLDRVGLGAAKDRRLRSFSKGMLQRAGLAQAMLSDPRLLILDEPMTGLDPIGRRDLRHLILELAAEGITVFYSTHILPDVEMTCSRVSIVHQGRSIRTGRLSEILEEGVRGVTVTVAVPDAATRAAVIEGGVAVEAEGPQLTAEFDDVEPAQAFVNRAVSAGAALVRFEPHREDLETIFVRSLGDAP
jgi:ABC-2 type transport system ATP-binding protein